MTRMIPRRLMAWGGRCGGWVRRGRGSSVGARRTWSIAAVARSSRRRTSRPILRRSIGSLAMQRLQMGGSLAPSGCWSARSCSERGWLEVERAKRSSGRPSEHESHARAAVLLARELRDCDLEAASLAQLGLARVDAGDVDGGLVLLDEAMTRPRVERRLIRWRPGMRAARRCGLRLSQRHTFRV
jgi:hypothetical protein